METAWKTFESIVTNPEYQGSVSLIKETIQQQHLSVEEWAEQLYRLFEKEPQNLTAVQLNHSCKTILMPVFRMIDEYYASETLALSCLFREQFMKLMTKHDLFDILTCCLCMDRARSLFKTKLPNEPAGVHWYSESQSEFIQDRAYRGNPTINARYETLGRFFHSKTFDSFLTPCLSSNNNKRQCRNISNRETEDHFRTAIIWYDQEHIQDILAELHASKHKHGKNWEGEMGQVKNIQDYCMKSQVLMTGVHDLFSIKKQNCHFDAAFLKLFKLHRLLRILEVAYPITKTLYPLMGLEIDHRWSIVLDSTYLSGSKYSGSYEQIFALK